MYDAFIANLVNVLNVLTVVNDIEKEREREGEKEKGGDVIIYCSICT